MRPLILSYVLVVALARVAMAYFELVPDDMGLKAHEIDTSDEYKGRLEEEFRSSTDAESAERFLETLRTIEGKNGCTWLRFTSLLDLLRESKKYPTPLLVKIAIAKQFSACNQEVFDLPAEHGLEPQELKDLSEFSDRIKFEDLNSSKALVKGCLTFLKENRGVSSSKIKKDQGDRHTNFKTLFFKEMDFCFKIDNKLRHYFEFVDQLASPKSDLLKRMPVVADRVKLGKICRAFVNKNQHIENKVFKKIAGRWYNFKKLVRELSSDDDEDIFYDWD